MQSNQNFRTTRQRIIILEEVRRDDSHPTADEIYARVRKRMPKISLGTIYRNLDIMASRGLIRKIEPGLPQMRFDGETKEHYHMTCAHCGSLEDRFMEPADDDFKNLESSLGCLTRFGVFGHRLELIGLCEKCRATDKVDQKLYEHYKAYYAKKEELK